jgi:hypothetical protein
MELGGGGGIVNRNMSVILQGICLDLTASFSA